MALANRSSNDDVPFASEECPITDSSKMWFEPPETENNFRVIERLRGGADKDEDDDEFDEEKPGPARKKGDKSEEEKEEPTRLDKIKKISNMVKIGLLLVTWIICTVCLILSKKQENNLVIRLVSVNVGQPTNFPVPKSFAITGLGLEVIGPFTMADVLEPEKKHKEGEFLLIQIEHIDGAVIISNLWKLRLSNEPRPHNIKKENIFKLRRNEAKTEKGDVQIKFTSTSNKPLALKIIIDKSPIDRHLGIIFASLILIGLYIMIVWDLINRTFAALIAATTAIAIISVMNSRPTMESIMKWVDIETMLLLFGMMIMVAVLSESGIFDYLAVYAYKITHGRVWPLVYCLCLFTAVLSTFLDSVTMMLLVTPVTIRLCEVTGLNPVPVLMCMVIYTNIGAAITPVGDPPNILITTNVFIKASGINFGMFVLHMMPPVVMAMISTFFHLRLRYRHIKDISIVNPAEVEDVMHEILVWERTAAAIPALSRDEENVRGTILKKIKNLKQELKKMMSTKKEQVSYEDTLKFLQAEYPIRNKPLLYKSIVAFAFVIVLFLLHSVPNLIHISLGYTALLGAIMLLILADIDDMQAILGRVEWSTLLFFAGLLILMECLTELGLIDVIGNFVVSLVMAVSPNLRLTLALCIIIWVTAIASSFLDNIPVTTMMVRIIISLSHNGNLKLPLHPLVWALSLGACFGGNGTLIGASANVVSAGVAEQHGYKISFLQFFVTGFPVVLTSTAVATIYLLIAHVLFQWH